MKKIFFLFVFGGLLAGFYRFASSPEGYSTSTDVPYHGTEDAHAPETTPGERSEDDPSGRVQPTDSRGLDDSSSPSQNPVRSAATSKQRTVGAAEVNAPENSPSGTERTTGIAVPAHMADRFTPEEYAAWKAKRQAAFGGPPLQRTLEDIPESTFRTQLEGLSEEGRANALATFNRKRIPMEDVPSLRVDNEKGILAYQCAFDCGLDHHGVGDGHGGSPKVSAAEASQVEPVEAAGAPVAPEAPVAVSIPPAYNSKPGAPFTLYLDFNGGKVSGTNWNNNSSYGNVSEWDFAAWSSDGDTTMFSDSEQATIYRVWQRMSEDFAPFDINVSTDVSFDPDNNGGRSNSIGIVMFVPDLDKNGVQQPATGGGVASLGVVDGTFGDFANYQPAWVNTNGTQDRDDFMAAAGSHEFGHNLDLSHDGESGGDGEYYNGHGSKPMTWGPIMGPGYYADMTQWSKGEYLNATNTEDDLVIIETSLQANVSNSIGYRTDDHGDTRAAATALDLTVATINAPATTDLAGDEVGANEGIIERNTDIDYWSFFSGSGSITITASPFVADNGTSSIDLTPTTSDRQNGTNLDVKLVLYDSSGTVLATADPSNSHAATLTHSLASSGTYYISIEGSGWGDPIGAQTGWTDYGSIGQYFLSGSVAIPNDPPTDIALVGSTVTENEPSGIAVGTLSSTDPDSGDTAAFSLVSGTGDTDNAEFQISGTQLQTAGPLDYEAGSTRSVRIRVTDSQGASYEEAFTITVTDADDAPAIALVWPDTDTVGIPTGVGLVLDSTVTDDGFGGSSLTFTWSKVSGLGSVSWDNQNQADTAVTFSADGDYVLRLTAFDGTNTTTQDFIVTVGASSGGGLSAPPTPDLHYAFDESSGTAAADSAGSNNGSVTGTASWVAGQRGGAIEFDTNVEYVQSASAVALTAGSTWSASAWFRLNTAPATTGTRKFLQQNNGPELKGRTWFGVLDDSGTYRLTSFVGGAEATTGGEVTLGAWYHAAIVADGTNVALYLDGVEVARTTQAIEANSAEFRIGNHKDGNEGADNQWFGAVDDLALYNRELTAQEISTMAGVADTTAGPTDSLIGRWQLNDASGSTASDDSGNANNGTLNGPIWADGRWGGALDFDGSNDYVDFGDVDAIDGATALSISLWARFDNTTADHTILSKSNFAGSASSFMLWRDESAWGSGRTDTITMAIGDSSSSDIRIEGATGSLGDTGWHHIVVTFQAGSASGLRLYIDGVEDANSPVDVSSISALPVSSSPLRLGTSADTLAGKWLDGAMDEVRIYNRVLTPSEVTALGEAAPSNTGPVVEAGGPYNGLISETVSLDGTVSDGEGDSTTTVWSQISGPASASFGNTAVVDTTVSSATDGSYVLRLSADDGAVKTFDDANFTVASPAGPGELYFESASYSVNEAGTSVILDVRRGGGIDGEVSVTYNTANGSATAGSDYTAVTGGTLTWADQENGLKSFTVTITDNSSNEGDETFTVALSNPTNSATVGSPSSTTVTIVEDDLPPLAASGLNASASDRYQIDLSWIDNSSTETGFKIERKTGAGSYSLIHTTAANVISYNDTPVSDNTSYTYRVTATNAFGDSAPTSEATATTPATANGTLALSSATYSGAEDGGSITITVTRSGGSDDAVSVGYATSNGTATAGSDYSTAFGTLNWSDEDGANKTFTVNLTPDTTYEGDETFTVTLSGVTGGASLGTGTATVTITEDDPIPAGARVTAQSPVSTTAQSPGLTELTLTFSESMDPTSFVVADDVLSFTGGQGTDVSANITGHSWANNDTELTITFNALNTEANYRLVVGPEILNLAGWPMDQDQDDNLGEAEEDTYAANLWVATGGSGLVFWSDLVGTDALDAGWTTTGSWASGNAGETAPSGPDAGADGNPILGTNLSGNYTVGENSHATTPVIDASGLSNVTLTFQGWKGAGKNDVLYVDVFDGSLWQNVYTYTGPNGGANDTAWSEFAPDLAGHADGNNALQFRWRVVDLDNPSSGTQTGWQIDKIEVAGDGAAAPPPAPVVVDHSPVGTVVQGVSSLYVNFSQPMDTTSFASGDIDSFTGPAGSISASGFNWVSDTVLRIDFAEESADGLYTLILAPTVLDDWGQSLDQDKDATAGETSADAYTATFTIASGTTYAVDYHANGATGGTAPDSQTKNQGEALTLALNSGSLVKTGYTFSGWNTQDDGLGTDYAVGDTYSTDAAVLLYAKWVLNTVNLMASESTLSVNEGSTADFTVVLSAQPTGSVSVSVTNSSGDADLTVSTGSSLTFTTTDWATPQTVTLAAAEDADALEGSSTISVTSASATDTSLTATEVENDAAALTLSLDPAGISEDGGSSTATVSRNTGTSGTLEVTLSSDDSTEATVPASVTIADGSSSATFTVTGVDDTLLDGTQSVTITASAAAHTDGTDNLDVTDDAVTLTVNAGTGGSSSPSGATSVDPDAATPITATADAGYSFVNWTGETTGIGNANNANTSISPAGAQTLTANFSINTVNLVASESTLTVNEGSTADFTVVLSAQPTGSVSVSVANSSGDADLTVSTGSSLTFTTTDWATPQTVTLAAAEDADTTDSSATISITSATATDTSLTATEQDNDSEGVLQFTASTASVAEDAGIVTLTVSRTGGDAGAVSVDYATSNSTAIAGSDYVVTTGTLNWADGDSTDKTFDVTITDDSDVEGSETFTVSLSNVVSATLGATDTATVTITDNEFSPSSVPGLVGWYDAQALSGSDGTQVTTWADTTGGSNSLANDLSQVSLGVQSVGQTAVAPTLQTVALNGYNYRAVRFVAGTNGEYELLEATGLVTTGDTIRTLIVVYEGGIDYGGCRVAGFGSKLVDGLDDKIHFNIATDGNGTLRFDGAYNMDHGAGLTRTDTLIRTAVMESSSSFDEYIDVLDGNFADTQVLSNGAPNVALGAVVGDFYLGDLQTSSPGGELGAGDFDILEVLVFDTALTDIQRQNVQNWLKAKYTTDPNIGSSPDAPSGLSASASSSTQIDLSWVDNSPDETGFKVQRSGTTGGPWTTIDTTPADATGYSDTGLTGGTEYFYQVIATNSNGDSAPTTEASATTPKEAATVTLSDLTQTYDGTNKPATVTTDPADLTVTVTYDASGTVPTAAGSYDVVATVNDAQYQGSDSGTLVIQKAVPVITTAPTASQISFGQSLADSILTGGVADVAGTFAFTTPATAPDVGTASQEVTFTPTDAANYTTATVNVDVTVIKALATVTLSNLTQTYDGTAKPATVTTDPADLTVDVTYDGSGTVPTAAGSYDVVATVNDAQYQGSDSGTLVIQKAVPVITTAPTASQISFGQSLADSTLSGGVASVAGTFAFTTPATAPDVGTASQEVTFTPTDAANYTTATVNVDVTVIKALATVTLSNLTQTYDGTPKPATVTTDPTGLTVNVTYDGSETVPTAAGSYAVEATVDDVQYQGSDSGTLVIQQAAPVIAIAPTASQISFGQSLADSILTGGAASVAGTFAFTTPATAPDVGTASQEVTFTPTDAANYTTATVNVDVTVIKALATVTLSNLTQTYDGTAKPATVTTDPADLTVDVTYDGSGTVPTAAGSYDVVATVNDAQYQGSDSGTLVIDPATLEVTADDKSKTEGDADPLLTSQITSGQLYGSDTLSGSLTRQSGATSGTYAIQQGTLTAGSNYTLSFVSGTLTILTEGGILDSDTDDMDDTWESTHSQPGDPDPDGNLDPDADNDSDGASNYEEFMAGTDPNDGTKFLKLMGMTFDGLGQPVLEWTSVQDGTTPARTYKLQVGTDLTNPNSWSDVVSGVGSEGNTTSRTDDNATPPSVRHYRVVPE